jgi:dTDP-4-dehydrorhamnose reductase
MRNVLLIGSNSFLGRCLYAALQTFSQVNLLPTHRQQGLFPDSRPYDFWHDDLEPLLAEAHVDTLIMAASVAAPDLAIEWENYQRRVERFVQAARSCRFIYISSDGIFDGKQGLYAETDVPTPSTVYGRNLQYFEECVQMNCTDYCITRPSYLYGYTGSELDRRRLARVRADLLSGQTVTAFCDMFKSPMEVNQVAQGVASLALSQYIGLMHVAGPRMSVYDFYREAMEALGVSTDRLMPEHMPLHSALTRDTSLRSNLLLRLTGIEPLTVREALRGTRQMP